MAFLVVVNLVYRAELLKHGLYLCIWHLVVQVAAPHRSHSALAVAGLRSFGGVTALSIVVAATARWCACLAFAAFGINFTIFGVL